MAEDSTVEFALWDGVSACVCQCVCVRGRVGVVAATSWLCTFDFFL